MKQVLIVGAGSIGLLFGRYFQEAGLEVVFMTRTRPQAIKIEKQGIQIIDHSGHERKGAAKAFSHEEDILTVAAYVREADLILVTLKQHQVEAILPLFEWLDEKWASSLPPFLFLMNGLGHQERLLESMKRTELYWGITSHGALKIAPNKVLEKGRGRTKVGQSVTKASSRQSCPAIKRLTFLFQQIDVEWSWSEQIELEMLKKCIINACINPLTALFQVPNGALLERPGLQAWMYSLYTELDQLLRKSHSDQYRLLTGGDTLWREVEEICQMTAANRSSMLQDVMSGQKTEIEAINGYFIREANKVQHIMPHHHYVYQSIRLMEQIICHEE